MVLALGSLKRRKKRARVLIKARSLLTEMEIDVRQYAISEF
jgi:hypothetical protein